MARLFTSGFEVNTTDSGHEWSNVSGSPSTSTNVVRSGSRAAHINGLTSGTRKGWAVQFASSLTSGPFYTRLAIRVDTLPTAANAVFALIAGANVSSVSANDAQIRLNSDGTLALFANDSQVGSASAVLDLARWYEICVHYDNTGSAGAKTLRAYLDGVEWAGSAALSDVGGTVNGIAVGANLRSETQTTAVWYLDDAAVNDSSGSAQTGLPTSGRVIIMLPDGSGDSNDWNNTSNAAGSTSNYTLVDENPPDDATTMVQSGTANNVDLYAFESSGIGIPDTVNVVHILARRRNNVADATTSFATVVQKTTGGTQSVGASTVPNTTTWRTGGPDTNSTVRDPNQTLYTDPDGAAWTQSTLGTMQAGVKLVTAGTNRVQVSTVHATVDYTPAPARRFYLANAAADYAPTTIRGAWDDSTATLTRKLSYTPSGAAATAVKSESSATNDFDVLLGRWISDPATVAGTLSGYMHWVIGASEGNLLANMVFHWHLFVTAGDSDTVRGTLRTDYVGSSEWPTTASGRSGLNITMSSVDVQVGDRLVLEMGYRAANTDTSIFNGTINYGNTGLSDLTASSQNVTTQPGWIEITGAESIFDPDGGGGTTHTADSTTTGTGTFAGTATVDRATTAGLPGAGALTGAATVERSAAATLTGVGALTAATATAHNADSTTTGTGALTGVGALDLPAASTTTIIGTLAGAPAATRDGAATLTGVGALTGSGATVRDSPATLAGTGALAGAPDLHLGGSAPLSAAGTLAGTPIHEHGAAATLPGAASLSAAGLLEHGATAGTSGAGSLTGGAAADRNAAAALTGAAELAGAAAAERSTAAALTVTGALAAAGSIAGEDAPAALDGAGTLTAAATTDQTAIATLGVGAALTVAGTAARLSTTALDVTGALVASAVTDTAGTTILAATGTLEGSTTASTSTTALLAGGATLSGVGAAGRIGTAAIGGTALLAAVSGVARVAAGTLPAGGTLTGSVTRSAGAAASVAAVGALSAAATVSRAESGVLIGAGALTAVGVVAASVIYRPNTGTVTRPYTGVIYQP